MVDGPKEFVHVLLFACPQCVNPIAATHTDSKRSLEDVDNRSFACECRCGWNGNFGGFKARRHWVEPWAEFGTASSGS